LDTRAKKPLLAPFFKTNSQFLEITSDRSIFSNINCIEMCRNYYGVNCFKFGPASAVKLTFYGKVLKPSRFFKAFGVKKINERGNKLTNNFSGLVTSNLGPDVAHLVAETFLTNMIIFFPSN
jgi:hypothetical protein